MARIVTIVGSPSEPSRTALLVDYLAGRLELQGHSLTRIVVRDLPAQELLHGRLTAPPVAAAVSATEQADGVVVATPVYKASFCGVLKVFLDLLPQQGLRGKVVQPLGTAGSPAHTLAIDYALRTVLAALGAEHILSSYVDVASPSTDAGLSVQTTEKLDGMARRFDRSLRGP
jgi:SsuE family FMN reductase